MVEAEFEPNSQVFSSQIWVMAAIATAVAAAATAAQHEEEKKEVRETTTRGLILVDPVGSSRSSDCVQRSMAFP